MATEAASTATASTSIPEEEARRQEIEAAVSKSVELRALHAALILQGNSAVDLRFPSMASPISRPLSRYSGQDYPVFTPSYEEEPLPGFHQTQLQKKNLAENWHDDGRGGGGDDSVLSDCKENSSSRKAFSSSLAVSLEPHTCPAHEDPKSISYGTSMSHHVKVLQTSPGTDLPKPRRNSLGDFRSASSCNKCRPAIITSESDTVKNTKSSSNVIVPLMECHHSSSQSQPKTKGAMLSWLFPRSKKHSHKHKNDNFSPSRTDKSEEVSQIRKDLGIISIEMLKKQLLEANQNRDAALLEVTEMKYSLEDLKQKLEYLETYCEGLKKALRQATQGKGSQPYGHEKMGNLPKRGKSIDGGKPINGGSEMPVPEEVMVEGFLQIVSEARLSVKQFCKTLVADIEENDSLMENLNAVLLPYKVSLNSKPSKVAQYHLEAIINQYLYQDFENCVFQKNGSPKFLDPQQNRQAQFSSFVALRNLSWNEVLRKGTKYYSDDFSKFCDQKMSGIILTLNWTRPWPETLLQSFFVAAKCIWLLHLLAFSFDPPLGILRVDENQSFDPHYMEDVLMERHRSQKGSGPVKVTVMPGFYVQERVLRCKVVCR